MAVSSHPALTAVTISTEERLFFVELGGRISELRKAQGMTQVQLAEVLGVAQQTLQAYEGGARRMPVSTLPLLAKTLGVSLEVLFGEESAKPVRSKRGSPCPPGSSTSRPSPSCLARNSASSRRCLRICASTLLLVCQPQGGRHHVRRDRHDRNPPPSFAVALSRFPGSGDIGSAPSVSPLARRSSSPLQSLLGSRGISPEQVRQAARRK